MQKLNRYESQKANLTESQQEDVVELRERIAAKYIVNNKNMRQELQNAAVYDLPECDVDVTRKAEVNSLLKTAHFKKFLKRYSDRVQESYRFTPAEI